MRWARPARPWQGGPGTEWGGWWPGVQGRSGPFHPPQSSGPLLGRLCATILVVHCVYVCARRRGENPRTAGEGVQLSDKDVGQTTSSLDLQGTLSYPDSRHFVLLNAERRWREGSSRRGLGLRGWRIPASVRGHLSNDFVRTGQQGKAPREGAGKQGFGGRCEKGPGRECLVCSDLQGAEPLPWSQSRLLLGGGGVPSR